MMSTLPTFTLIHHYMCEQLVRVLKILPWENFELIHRKFITYLMQTGGNKCDFMGWLYTWHFLGGWKQIKLFLSLCLPSLNLLNLSISLIYLLSIVDKINTVLLYLLLEWLLLVTSASQDLLHILLPILPTILMQSLMTTFIQGLLWRMVWMRQDPSDLWGLKPPSKREPMGRDTPSCSLHRGLLHWPGGFPLESECYFCKLSGGQDTDVSGGVECAMVLILLLEMMNVWLVSVLVKVVTVFT